MDPSEAVKISESASKEEIAEGIGLALSRLDCIDSFGILQMATMAIAYVKAKETDAEMIAAERSRKGGC